MGHDLSHEIAAGDVERVKHLLANSAGGDSFDFDHIFTSGSFSNGCSALHCAAITGQDAMIEYIISRGANVNIKAISNNNGMTPLHSATFDSRGKPSTIKTLLDAKANINAVASNGCTAMHMASFFGYQSKVEVLLQYSPDLSIKDVQNKLPVDYAKSKGFHAIEHLIQSSFNKNNKQQDIVIPQITSVDPKNRRYIVCPKNHELLRKSPGLFCTCNLCRCKVSYLTARCNRCNFDLCIACSVQIKHKLALSQPMTIEITITDADRQIGASPFPLEGEPSCRVLVCIIAGSPLGRYGIVTGDFLTKIDGQALPSNDTDLKSLITRRPIVITVSNLMPGTEDQVAQKPAETVATTYVDPLKCPKGHGELVMKSRGFFGRVCDVCRQSIGSHALRCRVCTYDICSNCVAAMKQRQPKPVPQGVENESPPSGQTESSEKKEPELASGSEYAAQNELKVANEYLEYVEVTGDEEVSEYSESYNEEASGYTGYVESDDTEGDEVEAKEISFHVYDEIAATSFKSKDKVDVTFADFNEFSGWNLIGKGHFGYALTASWERPEMETKQQVVVKVSKTKNQKADMKEVQVFFKTPSSHVNVLQILAILQGFQHQKFKDASKIGIVTPLMHLGDLTGYARKYKDELRQGNNLIQVALGMARGIEALHNNAPQIIHRDIATRNYLVSESGQIVIADFGMSRFPDEDGIFSEEEEQSEYYVNPQALFPWRSSAPETLKSQKWSTRTDVWMYGVSLWEVVANETPFKKYKSMTDLSDDLRFNSVTLNVPEGMPPALQEIMKLCTQVDSAKRPTMTEIVDYFLSCQDQKPLSIQPTQEPIPSQQHISPQHVHPSQLQPLYGGAQHSHTLYGSSQQLPPQNVAPFASNPTYYATSPSGMPETPRATIWASVVNMIDDAEECEPPLISELEAEGFHALVAAKNDSVVTVYEACQAVGDPVKRLKRFIKNMKRIPTASP